MRGKKSIEKLSDDCNVDYYETKNMPEFASFCNCCQSTNKSASYENLIERKEQIRFLAHWNFPWIRLTHKSHTIQVPKVKVLVNVTPNSHDSARCGEQRESALVHRCSVLELEERKTCCLFQNKNKSSSPKKISAQSLCANFAQSTKSDAMTNWQRWA